MQAVTVSQIVEFIFTKPPAGPCTYNVIFADNSPTMKSTTFNLLMDILITGAKKLYGENIIPAHISEEQFDTLKKYISSIGYHLKYNYTYAEDNKTILLINIWFEPYTCRVDCHGIKTFT